MEIIIITGKVTSDAELVRDKNGREFVRFRVQCWRKGEDGKDKYTDYSCYSYYTGYKELVKNEMVTVTGTYMQNVKKTENNETFVNNQIFVEHLSRSGVKK